jgi:hypothetical protein
MQFALDFLPAMTGLIKVATVTTPSGSEDMYANFRDDLSLEAQQAFVDDVIQNILDLYNLYGLDLISVNLLVCISLDSFCGFG